MLGYISSRIRPRQRFRDMLISLSILFSTGRRTTFASMRWTERVKPISSGWKKKSYERDISRWCIGTTVIVWGRIVAPALVCINCWKNAHSISISRSNKQEQLPVKAIFLLRSWINDSGITISVPTSILAFKSRTR